MYCSNCGSQIGEDSNFCSNCGQPIGEYDDNQYAEYDEGDDRAQYNDFGQYNEASNNYNQNQYGGPSDVYDEQQHVYGQANGNPYNHQVSERKSRVVAGLLQIFFGFVGAGRFYTGYTGMGVAQLLTTCLCGVGVIWSFIDGILFLCGQIETDAKGVPLR